MILDLINVSKSFGKKKVLSAINLQILPGENTIILGPSGAGKTTLLNVIAGFDTIDDGQIVFSNGTVSSRSNMPIASRNLGYVSQIPALWPHMTIFENIFFPAKVKKLPIEQWQILNLLDKVGMLEYKDNKPNELSIGQQQRVAVLRALISKPHLILFDEPFSGLDVITKEKCLNFTKSLLKEFDISSIYVTHDIEEATKFGHKIAVFLSGCLTPIKTIEDFFQNPSRLQDTMFNHHGFTIMTNFKRVMDQHTILVEFAGTQFTVTNNNISSDYIARDRDQGIPVFVQYQDACLKANFSTNNEHLFKVTDLFLSPYGFTVTIARDDIEIKILSQQKFLPEESVTLEIQNGIYLQAL